MKTLPLFISLLLVACAGPTKQEKEMLQQAGATHNAAYALAHNTENKLETLKGDTTVLIDSVNILLAAVAQWESELVEVPGNETHHAHAEDEEQHHHHEHGNQTDLTPQQQLTVQQEMKKQIEAIAARVERLASGPTTKK